MPTTSPVRATYTSPNGTPYTASGVDQASALAKATANAQKDVANSGAIPASTLSSNATPATVTPPAPATNSASLGGFIDATANQNKDSYQANLDAKANTAQTNADTSFQAYLDSVLGTQGKSALTSKEYASTGVDQAQQDLNDINNQILAEQTASRHAQEAVLKNNPNGLGAEVLQAKADQIQRDSISKQADLAVIQLAKQGKYDSAKAIADRAVEAKFEQQTIVNQALQLNYERNKDLFTTAEQRAFETAQADRNRALDLAQQEELIRYQELIKNSSSNANGFSFPTSVPAPQQSFEDFLKQKESELGLNIDPSSQLYSQLKDQYASQAAQISPQDTNTALVNAYNAVTAGTPPTKEASVRATFQQYIGNGDIAGAKNYLLRLAVSNLPTDQQNQAVGRAQAISALSDIQSLLNQANANGAATNILSGNITNVAEKLGTSNNPKLSYISGRILAVLQTYRRAMTGVAFSPSESAQYEQLFPGTTKTGELNTSKIQSLQDALDSNNRSTLAFYIGDNNYDTLFGKSKTATLPQFGTSVSNTTTDTTGRLTGGQVGNLTFTVSY